MRQGQQHTFCGAPSRSNWSTPLGSLQYSARIAGMRHSGIPIPTMSWQAGRLTPLMPSVTGCSTWGGEGGRGEGDAPQPGQDDNPGF